ncbi:hypothetical protein B0J13DRAFT_538875 [Dactylonectria estremocensis]|uniref:Uncharacterized protein n=1 Tax=Dactylonectria estremocensis TaxID=1079267 RepID=A0A9P9FJ30_9HYPO|nr:hypothetical protein B0J13DRAFT_538875 [Dactylonectria estremocensis]
MDWPRDALGLSETELTNVFRYVPRDSTFVRMVASTQYQAEISSLESDEDWRECLQKDLPSIKNYNPGLVLLLAKRTGEPSTPRVAKVSPKDWLQKIGTETPLLFQKRRATTFSPLSEKPVESHDNATIVATGSGRRGVRTLPFSRKTFELISRRFFIHSTIARVISRTDVPFFSSALLQIEQPAYVYNCRSSNAWEGDLALSATYFPRASLTFAIIYGCTASIEEEIIKRLSLVRGEARHPALMPGIFAELERSRHMRLVQSSVALLERRILELEVHPGDVDADQSAETQMKNQDKRTAWLDTTYLRNGLVSWNNQLGRMIQSLEEVDVPPVNSAQDQRIVVRRDDTNTETLTGTQNCIDSSTEAVIKPIGLGVSFLESNNDSSPDRDGDRRGDRLEVEPGMEMEISRFSLQHHPETSQLRDISSSSIPVVGEKIKSRLQLIRDEYLDWIRDCTMRVDGMAMATQWAQGETNVEIALATKRDSRYMRSIAVLTMVFLPGTFLAGVFSMTFFDWNSEGGGVVVSGYVWVYALVAVILTLLTMGAWYYFAIFRPRRRGQNWKEEDFDSR